MASNPKLTFTVTADDQSGATLKKIKAAVASLGGSMAKTGQAEKSLGKGDGVGKLDKSFSALGRSAGRATRIVTAVAPSLAAITSAASIAGIAALTYKWANFGQQLGFNATRIGIAAESLQGLEGAAQIAGAASGSLTAGIRTLKDTITDTVGGRNAEALVYFRTLHVEFQKAGGSARSVAEVLPEVMDALAKIRDPTLRARAGVALLGGAYEDLAPFVARGSAGLAEYNELARKHGLLNASGVQSATELARAETELGMSVRGMGFAIAEGVAPPLKDLLGWMSNLLDLNRKTVSARIGGWADQFGKWIKSIDWDKVATTIERIAAGIGDILSRLSTAKMPIWVKWALGLQDRKADSTHANEDTIMHNGRPDEWAGARATLPEWRQNRLGMGSNGMRSEAAAEEANKHTIGSWFDRVFGNSDSAVLNQWSDKRHALGLTDDKYSKFHDSVVAKEGTAYDEMGGSSKRFAGKYQMGAEEIKETAAALGVPAPSQQEFLGNPSMQDRFFDAYTMGHYNQLARQSPEFRKQTADQQLQTLAYAHNQGVGGAMDWLKTGVSGKDAFGTTGQSYADDLANRQGGSPVNAPAIAPPYSAGGAQGTGARNSLDVLVKLQGAPAGSTATVTGSGDVKGRALIERPHFAGAPA